MDVAQLRGPDVENADVGADADRDLARARAGDAGAEDDDLRRTYAGDAREQDAATAVGRLQTPRARLHRELARDLAHRREQRQRAVVELDRLVGDGAHAALDEHARQRLVGGEVEIREEDELRAHMAELFAARLFHHEHELRRPRDVGGAEMRARGDVGGVVDAAAASGAALDDHLVAVRNERCRAARRERDAILVGLDLLRDADSHLVMLLTTVSFTMTDRDI